ncbi:hypothetical protein AGMMS4956_12100 [Bacteroidia bacterium]|nr:hypothetical protein AGMMS4956_12100 [Bacteroidia bacterium]
MNYKLLLGAMALLMFAMCESSSSSNNNNTTTPPADTTAIDDEVTGEVVDTPVVAGYTLVWADNFVGDALDMENWNIEVNGDGGGNSELQYYRSQNVSVGTEPASGKNCLILTARQEDYQGKKATSGRINSRDKQVFTHGRVEASIWLPRTANGLWPAFWMMGNDYASKGWPACGEIDILEMGHKTGITAKTQDRYFNGACHWGPSWNNGAYPNYAKASTYQYSLQDTFHLYTLLWDEQSIKMYVDLDKYPEVAPYYEMGIADASDDNAPGKYFHKDFFILFNLAVGGNFPQIWDINNITALANGEAKMYVDYVRVFQKSNP